MRAVLVIWLVTAALAAASPAFNLGAFLNLWCYDGHAAAWLTCTLTAADAMIWFAWVRHHRPAPVLAGAALALFLSQLHDLAAPQALLVDGLWLLFLLVAGLSPSKRMSILALVACLLGAHMVLGVVLYFSPYYRFTTPGFGGRAGGVFGTPNTLYPLAIMAFCLFISLAGAYEGRTRMLASLGTLVSAIVLVLTFSRGAWIGIGIVLLIQKCEISRRLPLTVAGATICGLAAVTRTHGHLASARSDSSTYGRLLIWQDAVHLLGRHPFRGLGYNAFSLFTRLRMDPHFINRQVPGEVKNLYLNVILENGLLGLTALAIFLFAIGVVAMRLQRAELARDDAMIARAVLLATVALCAAGIFDTPVFGTADRISATATYLVFVGLLAGASASFVPRDHLSGQDPAR